LQYELAEYGITLIDFNKVFIKEVQVDILDDLFKFKLLGKNLANSDVKKIFYHHIVYRICEDLLAVRFSKPIIIFNHTQLDDCFIKNYFKEDSLLDFLVAFINKLQTMLPIKIYKSKLNIETLQHLQKTQDARAQMMINALVQKSNTFDSSSYSFEKIKRFTKKYELTFLNSDYFNRIKTKQILI
jgi:hypothetical protein